MDYDLTRVARSMTRNLYQTDITANNLANINTTGFKRDDSFSDWFTEAIETGASQRYTTFTQGTLRSTENPLDLALSSKGFFVLDTPSGIAFTRNGHFSVSEDGFVTTESGYQLMSERGPISVTGPDGTMGDLQITNNGEIYVDGVPAGFLDIANMADLRSLEKVGGNIYRPADDAIITRVDSDEIEVHQGMLEGSNVDPVSEMVNLITYQREFESVQRVAKAMDTLLGRAVQLSEYR